MPRYAAAFGGMTEAESLTTISYYSIGSLVCVFAFAYLLKSKVRSVWAMTLNGLIACVASAVLYLYPSPFVCTAGAFLIGFSAAGGILQLGVAVMAEFFPDSKAKVTSVYMMMGGLANFVIPLATGYLSQISIRYVILGSTSVSRSSPSSRPFTSSSATTRSSEFLRTTCAGANAPSRTNNSPSTSFPG